MRDCDHRSLRIAILQVTRWTQVQMGEVLSGDYLVIIH